MSPGFASSFISLRGAPGMPSHLGTLLVNSRSTTAADNVTPMRCLFSAK
jgi:hypothetical protein